ncbi:hypothetical protein WME90_14475 [Sorangium sp. So ce375]|uniref:hypothetical protein n=1 Tax=Sorangium sp. So ce375 TaxID=3133306 RepID=UPI003F5C216D
MKKRRVSAALVITLFGSVVGCWTGGTVTVNTCDDRCVLCDNPCKVCSGGCVTIPPAGFDDPFLLWIGETGDEASVPDCPPEAPRRAFDGYAGFDGAHDCPSCRCTQPSCELPPALRASAGAGCDEDSTAFDAPAGWDGACAAPAAEIADEIGSLLIPAPTVSACEPAVEGPGASPELPAPWSRRARGCAGSVPAGKDRCSDADRMCVASPMPRLLPFRMCIRYLHQGTPKCPVEYPDLHTFFQGFEDTRGCSACACGPVEGSACSTLVSAYQDGSCERILSTVSVTLGEPKCITGPHLRFASMDAQWVENEPGQCAPNGGFATGEVLPSGQASFCCESDEPLDIR